ncbi:hypothetical protein CTEN210_04567 [Chaetoceros tenuissimus]|uniref:Uncharacterized protein n=1 Tax=Chaetoceros tenuissimus TaxID=426638 RepID=A0AAD3H2P3_9STRA|nr:hypothetical protein CTEN210_04567 [Chaetoceros tenuissimus]
MRSNTIGNICHVASSASVFLYTVSTLLYAKPGDDTLFEKDWIEHGFCVVNKTVPFWNSHDLCLYFDTILVLIGFLMYNQMKGIPMNEAADELFRFNMLGHLGHGIAHGFIATKYRTGAFMDNLKYSTRIEQYLESIDISEFGKTTAIGLGFWFALLKGIMPKVRWTIIAIITVLVQFGSLFVRQNLGFAYVQAVLAIGFASTQLTLEKQEKNFTYAVFAAASLPLSLIPWIESMGCHTEFVKKFGGHLMYDVAIPILLFAAYATSWNHYRFVQEEAARKIK